MEKKIKIKTIDESIRLLRLKYNDLNELYFYTKDNRAKRKYLHNQQGILVAIDTLSDLRNSVINDLF